MSNYFTKLNDIDVAEHIEKKGKFSYLSWPWAVEQMGTLHPNYRIEVLVHPETGSFVWMMPDQTAMVWVEVSIEVNGEWVKRGEPFPVLNHQNKPIANPNAFDVNTAIKRAKVKAFAEHGLGLYIYAGEDLPSNPLAYTPDDLHKYLTLRENGEALEFWMWLQTIDDAKKVGLHNSFETAKTKEKAVSAKLEKEGSAKFAEILEDFRTAIDNDDHDAIQEIGNDVGNVGKRLLYAQLTPEQQHKLKK